MSRAVGRHRPGWVGCISHFQQHRSSAIEQAQLPDQDIYLVAGAVAVAAGETASEAASVVNVAPPKDDPSVVYFAAVKSGTAGALADYIQRFPTHDKVPAAQALMASIEDDALWETTTAAGTVAAYRRYLLVFPEGSYAPQAEDWLVAALAPAAESVATPSYLTDTAVAGPTFDCALAATDAERAICTSPALAAQDHLLADAYKRALASGWTTKQEQRDWLTYRDITCVNLMVAECVNIITDSRITLLGE